MKISKTTLSGAVGAVSALLALWASVPPEVQNEVPQLFPEAWRGRVIIIFSLLAAAARYYQGHHSADSPPGPKDNDSPSNPVQTTDVHENKTPARQTIPDSTSGG